MPYPWNPSVTPTTQAGSYGTSIWKAPWGQMEKRLGAFWGRQVGRKNTLLLNRSIMGGAMALGGGAAGFAVGGPLGMFAGAGIGSFLGTRTTGTQALTYGAMGAALGTSIGGVGGGIVGAAAGGALGAVGPIHGVGALWKSGTAGKVALGTLGAAGVGVLGAAAFSGGFGADALQQTRANVATGLALTAPLVGIGAMAFPGRGRSALMGMGGLGLGASLGAAMGGLPGAIMGGLAGGMAGTVGGLGLGVRDAARLGTLGAVGKEVLRPLGGLTNRLMGAMAKRPGRMGGLLGMGLGLSGLIGGVVDAALSPDPVGSIALGSREALYGMDPNNLDTQALTLALHYRHQ